MNCIRTIPSLIWALIPVAMVGTHPVAGVVGLTFYSLGYLGKFFSDAFESIDLEVGAGAQCHGRRAHPGFPTRTLAKCTPAGLELFAMDVGIQHPFGLGRGIRRSGRSRRAAHIYQEYYQWDRFAAVLVFILGLVTVLDLAGEWVRKQGPPAFRAVRWQPKHFPQFPGSESGPYAVKVVASTVPFMPRQADQNDARKALTFPLKGRSPLRCQRMLIHNLKAKVFNKSFFPSLKQHSVTWSQSASRTLEEEPTPYATLWEINAIGSPPLAATETFKASLQRSSGQRFPWGSFP